VVGPFFVIGDRKIAVVERFHFEKVGNPPKYSGGLLGVSPPRRIIWIFEIASNFDLSFNDP
jgi:hypothetical protein